MPLLFFASLHVRNGACRETLVVLGGLSIPLSSNGSLLAVVMAQNQAGGFSVFSKMVARIEAFFFGNRYLGFVPVLLREE